MIFLKMDFLVSSRVTFITVMSILVTLPISGTTQPYRNVSLNSFLVADDSNSTWISPSGDFAFGFRQVSGGYLLAIMFNELPERTIVWSANRNDPVERGSMVQLFADEELVLRTPTGQQIWVTSLVGPGVTYGAMVDTGNFMLAGNNSGVAWQSFNEPSDTLLPGQTLNQNGSARPCDGNNKSSRNRSALIITALVLLGGSVFLNLVMLFALRFKGKKTNLNHNSSLLPVGVNILSFSFNDLREATNEFSEELCSGACSKVYKGVLNDSNGRIVAVKKLDKIEREAELEFKAEVNSISITNHRNIVRLLGYCNEGKNKLLVYEYMQNGSLADLLFDKSSTRPKPNWHVRVQIAFSIARGLCYLHEECRVQIIHCDIKPQNVLLDECNMAKISDFRISKLLKPDQTKTMTTIRGTRGYVAPEWFRNMPITSKVDVYSFGILLLELLCCRKCYKNDEDESRMLLVDWAYDCYKRGTLGVLVAGDPEALGEIMQFDRFVRTSIWCVQEDPTMRPPMKRILQMLEGSVEVPAAPNPASFIN